jgi:hypothetical protein
MQEDRHASRTFMARYELHSKKRFDVPRGFAPFPVIESKAAPALALRPVAYSRKAIGKRRSAAGIQPSVRGRAAARDELGRAPRFAGECFGA